MSDPIPADYGQDGGTPYSAPSYSSNTYQVHGVYINGSTVSVQYQGTSATTTAASNDHAFGDLTIRLSPDSSDPLVPGSIRFAFAGDTFIDKDGVLYRSINVTTGAGIQCGTVNYAARVATLTNYPAGNASFSAKACLTKYQPIGTYQAFFRISPAPLAIGSVHIRATEMTGASISAAANADGELVAAHLRGIVDVTTGIVALLFGYQATVDGIEQWVPVLVDPSSITFDAVAIDYLPLDPEVIGLDPTRLPIDGRVPIFRDGMYCVIHNTQTETLDSPLSAGDVSHLSRAPVAKVSVADENGIAIPESLYTANLTAGTLTWKTPLDLSAYQQPLKATTRIEDIRVLSDVQINGQITLAGAVSYDYPEEGTYLSSALILGDLGSRIEYQFSQQTWTNVWSDERIGNDSIAKYDDTNFPIVVDNHGAVSERWAIIFTNNSGAFQVLGQTRGIVATGTTAADCAPANPVGGYYFSIPHQGFGNGWVTNNVLRFNTVGAEHNYWVARTVVAGPNGPTPDSAVIEQRGDSA